MDEECQKAKEGERMKTKKAKKWFMPTEQRWREGFFFYIIGLFLRVPDSLAERRRQGGKGVHVVSPQHTHAHTQTTTTVQRGLQEDIRRVCDRGDVGTLINHHRLITVATALLLAKHITPKQNMHTQSLTDCHTLPSSYKTL